MASVDPVILARACALLRDGGVVAYPTDTFYGLAVDPRMPAAVARLFALKGRQQGQALPVLAGSEEQAAAAADFNASAHRLARAFWPGPLSLVLPARPVICKEVRAADGTIAVRVPDCEVARALALAFGFCLTATSANYSGKAPPISAADVSTTMGDAIALVVDGGDTPGGAPSTLVDVRGAEPRLVRAGAVVWDRVLRSLQ
jgi:L-threonylcarbamoyladenylate synthase